MEEPQKNPAHQDAAEKNPIVVFFTNILASIKLPFPPKKDGAVADHPAPAVAPQAEKEPIKIKPAVVPDESDNFAIVTLPTPSFVPLKLEPDAVEKEGSTNPVLLWQVYAIGGFFILRWAWKRWNEHRGGKKSDDEPPPACD